MQNEAEGSRDQQGEEEEEEEEEAGGGVEAAELEEQRRARTTRDEGMAQSAGRTKELSILSGRRGWLEETRAAGYLRGEGSC